ncbi:MAG: hypothetical protein ACK5M7_05610 [Draconibacterium sp.]
MKPLNKTCFVCKESVTPETSTINTMVNLPVCKKCKGTDAEQQEEKAVLDSLADGFVCGCI